MGAKRMRISAEGARGARKAARAKIGRLGDNVLTKRVLAQYTQFAARFFEWAYGSPVRPRALNFDQLDQLCAEYVEHLWGKGEPKGGPPTPWQRCSISSLAPDTTSRLRGA